MLYVQLTEKQEAKKAGDSKQTRLLPFAHVSAPDCPNQAGRKEDQESTQETPKDPFQLILIAGSQYVKL